MRWLPKQVTPAGTLLPLSDRTAERLVQAVLSQDRAQRLERFRGAVEQDPFLALWGTCRSAACGCESVRTSGELAAWLADNFPVIWCLPFPDDKPDANADPIESPRVWAERAASGWVLANLAAHIAKDSAADGRAYFLGLLLGPAQAIAPWTGVPQNHSPALLPSWLASELSAASGIVSGVTTSAMDCVRLAQSIGSGDRQGTHDTLPMNFDPQEILSRQQEFQENWSQASGWGDVLHALAERLARLEKLEKQFQATLEVEKLDSLKELAYGAGHEINNPLANISARAQTLLADERDPERRRKLAAINTQAFRAHEMIADMMLFARPPQPRLEPIDLVAALHEIVAEVSSLANQQHSELVWNPPARPIIVRADKTQIAVAVRALCVNALEALASGGGRVEVSVSTTSPASSLPSQSCSASQVAQIAVSDNGPGISSAARPHLFDPFYSGREAGRGLGFGLSKCWRIVELHGGRVEVASVEGEGARFTIELPLADVS